jgi:hypothetical protein
MGWDVPHTSVCSITSTTVETTALCRLSTFKSRSRRRQRNLRPTLGLGQRPDALEEWQEANIPARGPLPRGAPDADLPRAKAGTSLRPPPRHTTVLGGMWWCVMVAPNGSGCEALLKYSELDVITERSALPSLKPRFPIGFCRVAEH